MGGITPRQGVDVIKYTEIISYHARPSGRTGKPGNRFLFIQIFQHSRTERRKEETQEMFKHFSEKRLKPVPRRLLANAKYYNGGEMNEYFVKNPSFPCQLRRRIRSGAFSLIEVVLALGVMSFGLVSIVGLLPVGLAHFRKAMDQTVQAQIAQNITHMIQRTPFADLGNLGSATYYFDGEGSPTTEQKSVYTVEASVASDADLNVLLGAWPSNNPSGKALQNVKAVHVVITNRTFPDDPQTITTYVANAGL